MQWSALEELDVKLCNKLSFWELVINDGQNQLEKLLRRLKVLTIGGKDMKKMTGQFGHFPQEFFLNLRELTLDKFDGNSSIQEIFVYEGEGPPASLPHLTTLMLLNLSELKYIWKEDAQCFIPILHKLEKLLLVECPRLKNLVPHHRTLSFKFLTELQVQGCGGFIKLIQSSSTAASLEQLKWMRIIGCQMIEEIVAADDGDSQVDDDIIIFSNLQKLELGCLPRLTSFCTANYTFKFPQLTIVFVRHCYNMKTFSTGITITPMLHKVYIDDSSDQERWNGDLNATVQHLFSETETLRLITADTSASSSNHPSEIQEICEESSNEPREEIGIVEQCNDPIGEKVDICGANTKPGKGKEKIEMSEEDPNCQDQVSSSYASNIPFHGESSVSTVQQSDKSEETVPSSLGPANKPEEQTIAGSNSLLSGEQETKRLDTSDSSTSSNNHFEPTESAGKEAEEICEEVTEPRKDGVDELGKKAEISKNVINPENEIEEVHRLTTKDPTTSSNNNIEPIGPAGNEAEISTEATKPGNKAEVCESNDSKLGTETCDQEVIERGKVADTSERGKGKELEILDEEAMKPPHCPSLVVEAGTSKSASNSQPKDVQILRVTQELIALLSEFQTLQTQPLKNMSAKQVQFVEDAFHDLSNMNFSIEWFLPYTEKAREYLSVVERRKEISELELKIAETKARLQALEENKKALEDKDEAFGNIDLDKSLHDH